MSNLTIFADKLFSGDQIINISETVACVFILVSYNRSLSKKRKRFWEKFAKYLVTKKGIEKVTIHKGISNIRRDYRMVERIWNYYREPYLEFMDAFSLLETL